MRTGVSTSCLFPMPLEDALDRLLAQGIPTVEIFVNTESERAPAFARLLRQKLDAAGARAVSVHPYSSEYEGVSFFTRYIRRYYDSLEDYRRYFEFCNIVGAGMLVFHGLRKLIPVDRPLYYERFAGLREAGLAYGVEVCQENAARFHGGSADFLREMKEAIPAVGLVIDLKQARRAGEDPLSMLAMAGQNLRHIHVSDGDGTRDCLAPGTGSFDFAQMAALLQKNRYAGEAIIELYRDNYEQEENLLQSYRFLSRI